jgi:hypothetical protein
VYLMATGQWCFSWSWICGNCWSRPSQARPIYPSRNRNWQEIWEGRSRRPSHSFVKNSKNAAVGDGKCVASAVETHGRLLGISFACMLLNFALFAYKPYLTLWRLPLDFVWGIFAWYSKGPFYSLSCLEETKKVHFLLTRKNKKTER